LLWIKEVDPVSEHVDHWSKGDAGLQVVIYLSTWLEAAGIVSRGGLGEIFHQAQHLIALGNQLAAEELAILVYIGLLALAHGFRLGRHQLCEVEPVLLAAGILPERIKVLQCLIIQLVIELAESDLVEEVADVATGAEP